MCWVDPNTGTSSTRWWWWWWVEVGREGECKSIQMTKVCRSVEEEVEFWQNRQVHVMYYILGGLRPLPKWPNGWASPKWCCLHLIRFIWTIIGTSKQEEKCNNGAGNENHFKNHCRGINSRYTNLSLVSQTQIWTLFSERERNVRKERVFLFLNLWFFLLFSVFLSS